MKWRSFDALIKYVEQIDNPELNASNDQWIVVLDHEGNFQYLSPYYYEKTGFQTADVIGNSFLSFIRNDLTPHQETLFRTRLESGLPIQNFLFRRTRADHRPIYIRASGVPQTNYRGEFIGYLSTSQDISNVVDEIVSDGLLDVFDDCPLGVSMNQFRTSEDGTIIPRRLYCNNAFTQLFGYAKSEIDSIPISASWIDKDHFSNLNKRLHAGLHVKSELAARINSKGETIWLELTTQALNIQGQQYVIIWHNNVTQNRQHEAQLKDTNKQLSVLSSTDGLTSLANRREFDKVLRRLWNEAVVKNSKLGLMMVDIDHFKQFNDEFGHQSGDESLVAVANEIGKVARREGELAARYGGEEFAVILADTSEQEIADHAEILRSAISKLAITHPKSRQGYLTVSIGTAIATARVDHYPDILTKAADTALYRAKNNGRNRVEASDISDVQTEG